MIVLIGFARPSRVCVGVLGLEGRRGEGVGKGEVLGACDW